MLLKVIGIVRVFLKPVLMAIKLVLGGLSGALAQFKDLTGTKVDDKIFAVVGKIAKVVDQIIALVGKL